MCSLRGYQPDEERVVEITKLLTSGAAYFSWSHQGPSHTIDLTMAAQTIHRYGMSQNVLFIERAVAGSLISLTIGSSGTACCTSPMWGQESVLQTGWLRWNIAVTPPASWKQAKHAYISITFPGDVWECGDSDCICGCQTGNSSWVPLQRSILIKFKSFQWVKVSKDNLYPTVLGQSSNNISVE